MLRNSPERGPDVVSCLWPASKDTTKLCKTQTFIMFRCSRHLKSSTPIARGVISVANHHGARLDVLSSLRTVPARCLTTAPQPSGRHGSALCATSTPGQSHGRSHRGFSSQASGGGSNLPLIVGVGASVILGGILFMSSGSVTDDPSAKKKEEAKANKPEAAKEEKAEEPAPEPEEPPKPFPDQVQYLVVGAGTAAMTATKNIRKNDPTAKVLMVTEEKYRPYMRPPLSKELWFKGSDSNNLVFKDWAGKSKNVFYQPEEFFLQPELLNEAENGGVAIAYKTKVARVDVSGQTAYLADGKTLKYDKCLLATGGKPRNLPVFENVNWAGKNRVHLFRNIEDFHRLHTATDNSKSVVVVGGGFLGSELAVAIAQIAKDKKDLKVSQAFPEDGNMGLVFPEYLSKWTTDRVKEEGVDVRTGTFVTGCEYNPTTRQLDLTMQNGDQLSADHVVVAVGLQPNVELATTSGLEVDSQHGGFLVNAELEARKNLWVAGDAACFYDVSLGRRRVEHHDHAVVSGRLAGENMTGAGKPYWHQSMFWSDLGPSIGYEAIGICDARLPTFAVFAKSTEKDTPKAVVEETGEGMRSETETESAEPEAPVAPVTPEVPHPPLEGEDYGKGVIFYTRDDRIVGMVLWNLFGRMPVARQILKEGKTGQDLAEVAKLFDVHDQKKAEQ